MENERVQKLLESGSTRSSMWLQFGKQVYLYDNNFKAVSNYDLKMKLETINVKDDIKFSF